MLARRFALRLLTVHAERGAKFVDPADGHIVELPGLFDGET
jgi:hypothetical protein